MNKTIAKLTGIVSNNLGETFISVLVFLFLTDFNNVKKYCWFFEVIFKMHNCTTMKHFLFLLFVLPFFASAQDCQLKKETDQFSRQPMLSTGFMKFSSAAGSVALNMVGDGKEIKLLFSLGEGTCVDDQSTAVFSFDGSKTKNTQKNASSMNCDGIFTIVFRNSSFTPAALQKLTQQKVSGIILTDNSKKKIEINLTEEEKQLLMKKASCLVSESKTLIKS